jgi:DNA polymerase III subunit delta
LLSYASKANQQAILVMGFKYEEEKKSQTKILNQLKENAIIFKSEPVRDYHLNKWLTEYCSSQNISIEPKAIDLLAEHIGSNLQLLINEISKIRLNLSPSQSITQALVEQSVKANKEYSGFEFQDAFGERNNAKALRIANYFRNNEKDHHILKYLGPLFSYFQKVLLVKQHQKNPQAGSLAKMLEVNEYFVKKYVAAASRYNELQLIIILKLIYQYDLKAKGVENAQTDSGDLIVELTSKILLA